MGTSYDPTTYLNQQATTAPFVSREASAAERLRSSREIGNLKFPHGWSRGVARWFRWSLSVTDPFVSRCLTSSAMLPFPHPAHRTGRADLPHPALGEDSRNRHSYCL